MVGEQLTYQCDSIHISSFTQIHAGSLQFMSIFTGIDGTGVCGVVIEEMARKHGKQRQTLDLGIFGRTIHKFSDFITDKTRHSKTVTIALSTKPTHSK
jgi:hypothetical protein